MQLIHKYFSSQGMVNPSLVCGELPTTKALYKDTMKIAWPSIMEAVLVALVGAVDTMMVGRLGSSAIAAVGLTTQPKFILLAVIISLNVGVTAVVARRKGEDDQKSANRVLFTSLALSIVLSLVMSAAAVIFSDQIILLAGAKEDTFRDASDYFKIISVGLVLQSAGLTINAAQRGAGKTKISMITNLTANVVNCIFNYFLITGECGFPALGVKGAAIATVLGYAVAFALSLSTVFKSGRFLQINFHERDLFDMKSLKSVFNVASSSMVEQVFLRIGFFIYSRIVAELGTTVYATHQICMNILTISFSFGDGLSIAAAALVGQSLGENRPDCAILYGKASQRIGFVFAAFLTAVFVLLRVPLIAIFDSTPEIVEIGAMLMIILAFCPFSQIAQVVYAGCLRGAGDTKFVALVSFISIGIIRPGLSLLLCFPVGWGIVGAYIPIVLDQMLRFVLNLTRFSRAKWIRIKL